MSFVNVATPLVLNVTLFVESFVKIVKLPDESAFSPALVETEPCLKFIVALEADVG